MVSFVLGLATLGRLHRKSFCFWAIFPAINSTLILLNLEQDPLSGQLQPLVMVFWVLPVLSLDLTHAAVGCFVSSSPLSLQRQASAH